MQAGTRVGLIVGALAVVAGAAWWWQRPSRASSTKATTAATTTSGQRSTASTANPSGATPGALLPTLRPGATLPSSGGSAGVPSTDTPAAADLAAALATMGPRGEGMVTMNWGSAWPVPSVPYQATGLSVNVHGGPSTMKVFRDEAAPGSTAEATIAVTRDGRPVPDVVVAVGPRFNVMMGSLTGMWTGVTRADGTVVATTSLTHPSYALALDAGGWSAPTLIEPGVTRVALLPRASLRVEVREAGELIDAKLELRLDDGRFETTVSSASGVFEFGLLSPGTYRASAEANAEFASGREESSPTTVVVAAGQAQTARIDLPTDLALVVVQAAAPEGTTVISHALLDGAEPATDAELEARTDGWVLLGGQDANNPFQYHRVPAGPRLACVRLPNAKLFGCAPVTVPAGGVIEVTVPVHGDRP